MPESNQLLRSAIELSDHAGMCLAQYCDLVSRSALPRYDIDVCTDELVLGRLAPAFLGDQIRRDYFELMLRSFDERTVHVVRDNADQLGAKFSEFEG